MARKRELVVNKKQYFDILYRRKIMNSFYFLIKKYLRDIELYVVEKPLNGILFFIILLLFGPPIIEYFHELIKNFPYIEIIKIFLKWFEQNFNTADIIISSILTLLIGFIIFLQKTINTSKEIKEDFKKNLSKWSRPIESDWSIKKATDGLGKMLTLTNSRYPGLLKDAFNWYDYELKFQAMIEENGKNQNYENNKNIGIFVRSKDSSNGIMLQVKEDEFVPHYLFEGTYIVDDTQKIKLQTKIQTNTWINFKILVDNDSATIFFEGQKINFRINRHNLALIPAKELYSDTSISKISAISEANGKLADEVLKGIKNKETGTEFIRKREKLGEIIETTRRVNLEFNNGSIGFREDNGECANFRKISLKKIS